MRVDDRHAWVVRLERRKARYFARVDDRAFEIQPCLGWGEGSGRWAHVVIQALAARPAWKWRESDTAPAAAQSPACRSRCCG